MKLVLMGYMGSGKSVLAKDLSEKTGLDWLDLDAYIESKEGLKINQIFKEKGEIYFRLIEHKYLKEILCNKNNLIIATGGGTPCYSGNIAIINQNAVSIYLKGSIQTLAERLINEKETRPLLKNIKEEELKSFIAKHLFERNSFYNQATFTVSVDNKTVEKISNEIITLLN